MMNGLDVSIDTLLFVLRSHVLSHFCGAHFIRSHFMGDCHIDMALLLFYSKLRQIVPAMPIVDGYTLQVQC